MGTYPVPVSGQTGVCGNKSCVEGLTTLWKPPSAVGAGAGFSDAGPSIGP